MNGKERMGNGGEVKKKRKHGSMAVNPPPHKKKKKGLKNELQCAPKIGAQKQRSDQKERRMTEGGSTPVNGPTLHRLSPPKNRMK
jgi:hypothetical protein